jgi:hypothetical protein
VLKFLPFFFHLLCWWFVWLKQLVEFLLHPYLLYLAHRVLCVLYFSQHMELLMEILVPSNVKTTYTCRQHYFVSFIGIIVKVICLFYIYIFFYSHLLNNF